ncbi:MAG: DegT/DnrJ/EryC1/StrS family aminotransferase [Arcobacteraceae bacterium]|nr:DegT/DnrJ/EryC1/StrS family aminotransferase [Arcobacteraceae bacterium]
MGTAGLVGSFSFSAPKIISTGQGGALITNDDEVARKLRRLW